MTTAVAALAHGQVPPCLPITVFADGPPALSGDVNCNFSILENRINGNDTDIQHLDVNNVSRVASEGEDFSSLNTAMDSVLDARASNPFLIRITPGAADVKDHVYVWGRASM